MTAVASPPSVQSVPRLGWYPDINGGQGALTSPGTEDVSRMFMPRKSVQRTNSSSSLSSTSTVSAPSQHSNGGQQSSNSESGTGSSKKKPYRYIWSNSKSEPVSGVTNARSQAVPAPPSGTTASSAMSALQQQPPIVPSQHMLQSPQQNGIRQGNGPLPSDPPAILTLVPINGTFDRKQITVPYFPEVLRVGRQTNVKTAPTPMNGYFDSKVLSRQHAEVWADRSGKIWIRDVKSSNGTFVNGQRLSPENRDSDPHELREHDVLELGIDIVSEDQKSIVHHKVSAKVEHAGIYGPSMNVLDLNFGDIDPTAGGGLLPSHLSQPLSHMRGRTGSSSSMSSSRSAQSAAGSHLNALQQQRQTNYWLSPISIEQVVKRLSSEMKQAKQQTRELGQTNEFLDSLLTREGLEKERIRPSPTESQGGRLPNGRPKMPKLDQISRFSDPPAPPPQQPLPEKPNMLMRSNTADSVSLSSFKRSDTEKPRTPGTSPVNRDSSHILSLLESLTIAKKEIESQGARVKELEDLLRQERVARESAEERARALEGQMMSANSESEIEAAFEPPAESEECAVVEDIGAELLPVKEIVLSPSNTDTSQSSDETGAEQLQLRIEKMMVEMAEMRKQMEQYRQSSEKSEQDAAESRQTLAEMIESVRRERAEAAATLSNKSSDTVAYTSGAPGKPIADGAESEPSTIPSALQPLPQTTCSVDELEGAVTAFAKQRHRNNIMEQSAPYASMLGVVLLGVGIMAYLNGWQKLDK
ncbi:hypothetical protein AJ80_06320 [Polytolypa hystricis UAMH7299]|uniref:FHA domain-containing protein n=1 Tax=Polytolypa hystricis (strain UAMH7299) TaxID=1447883 RepID=A0A2B7XXF8_POLH7|nr:hypothetical protein AJ80_06320 [Polytolypa hystricis UAMH7299]